MYVVTLLLNEKRKKTAEKDLEMKKAQWEGLFHNTPVACVVFNSENDITSVNESFCSLFGYEREEVLGKNLDKIVADYPGLNQEAEAISGKVLSGEPVIGESLRRKKDGILFPVEYQGVTFPLEKGSFMGYAIYRDIPDQKKSEDEIRHNLRKESLISSVSARLLEEGVEGGLPSSFMEEKSRFPTPCALFRNGTRGIKMELALFQIKPVRVEDSQESQLIPVRRRKSLQMSRHLQIPPTVLPDIPDSLLLGGDEWRCPVFCQGEFFVIIQFFKDAPGGNQCPYPAAGGRYKGYLFPETTT